VCFICRTFETLFIFRGLLHQDEAGQEALVPANAVLSPSDTGKEDDGVGDEDWSLLAQNVKWVYWTFCS